MSGLVEHAGHVWTLSHYERQGGDDVAVIVRDAGGGELAAFAEPWRLQDVSQAPERELRAEYHASDEEASESENHG